MQRGMSRRALREEGASMVRMAMRYMWSAMDSLDGMPKRRQPSRGVVLRRVRRWRKGRGAGVVVEVLEGGRLERARGGRLVGGFFGGGGGGGWGGGGYLLRRTMVLLGRRLWGEGWGLRLGGHWVRSWGWGLRLRCLGVRGEWT